LLSEWILNLEEFIVGRFSPLVVRENSYIPSRQFMWISYQDLLLDQSAVRVGVVDFSSSIAKFL
jgi:hypothetical protein